MLTEKKVNNMAKVSFFDQENKPQYQRYFSDSFKKEKVRELERNISSVSDICKTYSVSRTSVYKWIYKYSAMAKKQVKQVVEAKSDTLKIRALEERIKELERIIGQKQLLLEFKEKMIEIAEATYGVDIKKKVGSKLSSGTISTEKSTKKS
jgi:transposase-like protein